MNIKTLIMTFVILASSYAFANAGQLSLANTNLKESANVYDVASYYPYPDSVLVSYRTKSYDDYWISLKTHTFDEYSRVYGSLLNPYGSFLRITLSHPRGEVVIEQQLPDEYYKALVDVYGNFFFLYAGEGNLKVFNLSYLPSKLEEVTVWDDSDFVDSIQVSDRLHYLNIRGKYLYDSQSGNLIIYDISSPSNPEIAAELDFSNEIRMLNIAGDRAYAISVKNKKYYLTVFKVTDGTILKELGKTKLGKESISDIDILNGYVYLCDGNLTIYDTADPKNIRKVYSSHNFVLGEYPTVKEFEFLSDKKHAVARSIVRLYGNKINITIISIDDFTDVKNLVSNNILSYSQDNWNSFLFVDFTTFKTDVFISAIQVYGCYGGRGSNCPQTDPVLPTAFISSFDNIELASPPSTELSTLIPRIKNRRLSLKWDTLYENSIQKFILTRKIKVSGNMQKSSADGKAVNYRKDRRKSIQNLSTDGGGESYKFVDKHLKRGSRYRYLLKYKDGEGKKHLLRKFNITIPVRK